MDDATSVKIGPQKAPMGLNHTETGMWDADAAMSSAGSRIRWRSHARVVFSAPTCYSHTEAYDLKLHVVRDVDMRKTRVQIDELD